MITEVGTLLAALCYLTCSMITEVDTLLTTPCYLTCTMITEVGTQLTTSCYLTCTMLTEVGTFLITPLLSNMYNVGTLIITLSCLTRTMIICSQHLAIYIYYEAYLILYSYMHKSFYINI